MKKRRKQVQAGVSFQLSEEDLAKVAGGNGVLAGRRKRRRRGMTVVEPPSLT